MFNSPADFIDAKARDEIKTMTLVEYKVLKDGEFVNAHHPYSGQKSKVAGQGQMIDLIPADGTRQPLVFTGLMKFSGRTLTVTLEKEILIYVINPIF